MSFPYSIVLVTITFFSTMIGGVFTLTKASVDIRPFFAFAAGSLLGISFFDLIPEAVSISIDSGIRLIFMMSTIAAAFLIFHALDRYMVLHAPSEGHLENGLRTTGTVKASGLSFHSLLEGVAIGTAFRVRFELGLVVALAVIFHDFSDGLNTVTVILRSGSGNRRAFYWLFLDSVTPLMGAAMTYLIPIPIFAVGFLLAFLAGEFLYLGAADLLPEAHHGQKSAKLVLATVAGVVLILTTTQLLQV